MSHPHNDDWTQTTCMGKQVFETAAMANKIAKRSSGRRDSAMNAYKCTVCRKFHIGNRIGKPKTVNQKPKRLDHDDDKLL